MGKIVIAYKIFPSDADINLEALKEKIKEQLAGVASVQKFTEEPIAFGLSALVVNLLVAEDTEGILEKIEKQLNGFEEISQIQTLAVNRL